MFENNSLNGAIKNHVIHIDTCESRDRPIVFTFYTIVAISSTSAIKHIYNRKRYCDISRR